MKLLIILFTTANALFLGISKFENPPANSLTTVNVSAETSKLYLLYPRTKGDKSYYVFFNKQNVTKINYGERQEFDFSADMDLLTVIQETEQYVEPHTSARNVRNLFLKQGKNYYLQINGKGQLEYIPDEDDGLKLLNDNGKYVSALKHTNKIN